VGLLWLLALTLVAGAALRIVWQSAQSHSLSTMSTSDLRIAAQDDPQNAEIRLALAERYLWEERNEDGLREATLAAKLAPRSSRAHYVLGKALQKANQAGPALKALERAVELDPNNAPARFLLGHGYYWHEQPLLAVKQFEQYVVQQPADDVGFRFLGLARLRLGLLDQAEPPLRRAVELGPESSGNHQALGNFYLNRAQDQTDRERAAAELLKAVELNPSADSNRIQAAVALQRLGRLREASEQFEILFAKTPTDEKVCYALLQLYTRLKDAPRAARYRKLYQKIVQAREARSAVTASESGGPSFPTR